MFCHNCGNQLPEGSEFCTKCGTKLIISDSLTPSSDTSPNTLVNNNSVSQQTSVATDSIITTNPIADTEFKAFVDNHIRTTTKFQSADDLLNNSKPLTLLWVCFGAITLFFTILAFPAGILLGVFFGYVLIPMVDWISTRLHGDKTSGTYNKNIDADELLQFLNKNLAYLYPNLHEWRYPEGSTKKMKICSSFGQKQKSFAVIFINTPQIYTDKSNSNSKQLGYYCDTEINHTMLRSILSLGIFSLLTGPYERGLKRLCYFKTAPILQAAMEYYLKSNGGVE
jgi:hypothetical protein